MNVACLMQNEYSSEIMWPFFLPLPYQRTVGMNAWKVWQKTMF